MKKRIAHISDTHLGARPREGVRPGVWGVEMRARLLENDFYERFAEIFDRIAALDPPVDLVIHSGDLYDSPWDKNPQSPPPVALETALLVLKQFIQKTGIPVLLIEGNHGLYRNMEVSLLDYLRISLDGVSVATYVDFKRALSEGRPLFFRYDELDVYCFPYIEPGLLESAGLVSDFNDWVTIHQKPSRRDAVSVAVAHGMDIDKTLHHSIFSNKYDYVALGHDHHQHQYREDAWYAGSPERWRFDESRHEKGFLLVEIEKGQPPVVTPQKIELERPVLTDQIVLRPDMTVETAIEVIDEWFESKGLKTAWNPRTAARVSLALTDDSPQVRGNELNIALEGLRSRVFTEGSGYNISQFVWSLKRSDTEHYASAFPEIESEYLIADPEADFKEFLSSKQLDSGYDPEVLTRIAVGALKFAVTRPDEKLTLEGLEEERE
ncbi:MAG: exonuclease SbcCD subunit D [Candidatus Thorarchaeota archaeon]|nr:exonuclease SbcCD subunit D [Candidatus Thorarchaeota archaeon]